MDVWKGKEQSNQTEPTGGTGGSLTNGYDHPGSQSAWRAE